MQNLIVTDAGLAALINAQHSGTTPIVITHLKLGSEQWRADASATNLKNVTKTFDVQYGGAVDAHTIQVAAIDQSEDQYVAYEMGIFTKDGTLFAIATSDSDPIIQKHASSINEILCRIVVRSANDGDLQVGDGNLTFLVPQASETAAGIAQFATLDEVIAGVETGKVIAPATLKTMLETFWGSKIPAGIILPWAGKSNKAPDGFLLLDGSKVSAEDFPRLAASKAFAVDGDGMMTLTAPPEGYALGFTQLAEKVMTIQDGKLPNITGYLHCLMYSNAKGVSGCIKQVNTAPSSEARPLPAANGVLPNFIYTGYQINASWSNPVFSDGFKNAVLMTRAIVSY